MSANIRKALTRQEHDAIVSARGRNVTDDAMRCHAPAVDAATPDLVAVSDLEALVEARRK